MAFSDDTTKPPVRPNNERELLLPDGSRVTFLSVDTLEGAQGRVRRARLRTTDGREQDVAVKTPLSASNEEALRRFKNEGECLRRMNSPRLPRYIWSGSLSERWYLIAEWKPGKTLEEWSGGGGALPLKDVRDLALGICGALAVAHRSRPPIVHRDIGPKNIIIHEGPRKEREVFVIDFGLARFGDGSGTVQPEVFGNNRYMSPEQYAGKTAQADSAADVFSVAAMLTDLARGWRHDQSCAKVIMKEGAAKFQGSPPEGFAKVWRVLRQSLEIDPARRPKDAAELHTALSAPGLWDGVDADDGAAEGLPDGWVLVRCGPSSAETSLDTVLGPLTLYFHTMREADLREPSPLPWSNVPGLLPSPLLIKEHSGEIALACASTGEGKVEMYVIDEQDKDKMYPCSMHRVECNAAATVVGLGRRRDGGGPLTLNCVGTREAERPAPTFVDVPTVGCRIVAPTGTRRLLALTTSRGGRSFVQCVVIR